jgi:hypothetical protein
MHALFLVSSRGMLFSWLLSRHGPRYGLRGRKQKAGRTLQSTVWSICSWSEFNQEKKRESRPLRLTFLFLFFARKRTCGRGKLDRPFDQHAGEGRGK